jgi:hypothetical protein
MNAIQQVREVLRLHSPVPFNGVECFEQQTIEGIVIRPGQLVFLGLRLLACDTRVIPNAAQFDPYRWLTTDEAALQTLHAHSKPFRCGSAQWSRALMCCLSRQRRRANVHWHECCHIGASSNARCFLHVLRVSVATAICCDFPDALSSTASAGCCAANRTEHAGVVTCRRECHIRKPVK